MAVAREFARWEIGDSGWADMIIDAYFDPDHGIAVINRSRAKFKDLEPLTDSDFPDKN